MNPTIWLDPPTDFVTDEVNATSTNAAQVCEKMKVGLGTRLHKWYIACGAARVHQQLQTQ